MITLIVGLIMFFVILKIAGYLLMSFFSVGGFLLKGIVTVILGLIGFALLFSIVGALAILIVPVGLLFLARGS